MTTPIWTLGFEHGVATIVTNGGGIASTITGSPTVQGTTKRSGNYALLINQGAEHANYGFSASTVVVTSFYVYYHAFPDVDNECVFFYLTAGANIGIKFRTSDKKLFVRFWGVSNGNAPNVVLELDTWYRVDVKIDVSANPNLVDLQVNGVAATQSSYAQAATTCASVSYGASNSGTIEMYIDDAILSVTSGDYPIGEHAIEGKSPASDGTHNAGTNVIEDNDGNDIGAVTAYDHINSVPIGDATTYIKQTAVGTANYAEINYADTAHSTVIGVGALLAYRSSDVNANEGGFTVIDEDATVTTVWGSQATRADYSESSVFYKYVQLPAPAGGWDAAAVNALKSRLGYSNDVADIPYWVDAILEVAYQYNNVATLTGTLGAATLTSESTLTGGGPNATLTATLGAATLTSDNDLVIDGDLTSTLGGLTIAATGSIGAVATLTATLGDLTFASESDLVIGGATTATLGAVTLTSANALMIDGDLTSTLGAVTLTSANSLVIDGDLTSTLGALTLDSTAVGVSVIAGSLTGTLGAVTLTSASTMTASGVVSTTLAGITIASTAGLTIAGVQSGTLGALTLSSNSALTIYGTTAATLGGLSLSALGISASITANLNITLIALQAVAAGVIVLPPGIRRTYKARSDPAYAAPYRQPIPTKRH